MKISVVIKKHNWGIGVSTTGKYTVPPHDPKDGKTYVSPVRGLFSENFDTFYVVKFTSGTPVTLPKYEGVYQVELSDDSSMWVDLREEVKRPTIRIKSENAVKFRKIADLKPRDNANKAEAETAFEEIE